MLKLSDQSIKELVENVQVFQRGGQYFKENRVTALKFNKKELYLSALVAGEQQYEVEVGFSNNGEINDIYCDCPAFYQYEGACKHIVAVLLAFRDRALRNNKSNTGENVLAQNILDYFNGINDPPKIPVDLELTLDYKNEIRGAARRVVPSLTMRMGEGKLYVVKNVKNVFKAMTGGETIIFGKNFTYSPHTHVFSSRFRPIVDLLLEMYEIEESMIEDYWYGSWQNSQGRLFKGKQVLLTRSLLLRLLSLLPSEGFNIKMFDQEYLNLPILERDLPLRFSLGKKQDDLLLNWERLNIFPLVATGEYCLFEGKVYKISDYQKRFFAPLIDGFAQSPDGIRFSKRQRERFLAEVLPMVKKIGQIDILPVVQDSLIEEDLVTEVYLDKAGDDVTAKVEFVYGEIHINPFTAQAVPVTGGKILVRDTSGEKAVLSLLEQAEFRTQNGSLYLKQEDAIYDFVQHLLPQVQQLAEVYYSENFRKIRFRDAKAFSGGIRLSEDSGMLEFSFELEGIDMAEMGAIFQSLREKKKYYRLKDGSFLQLDTAEANLDQMLHMIDALDLTEKDLQKNVIKLPQYRALYIDRCLKEADLHFTKNPAFKQLVQNITEPRDLEFNIPHNLKGELRDYQKVGFKWLKALAMYGLGGILADDMGLGKTIQTIAFIISEKEKVQAPVLVIAPTSVVYNWQYEAEKFAPDLQVVVVSGTRGERELQIQAAQGADLVITSYALIRRDVELYQDFNFGYCFLDEAQHIKNPGSLSAKAVKIIKARGYFALTGTPMENNLTELWSIFDFVMRGYLLSHPKFVKKFERPVIKEQNQRALQELQKQITPFILRRMKKEVLQELPPKIETRVLTDLTREQKKIYLTYLQQAKGEIEASIAAKGFENSQIKILAALTRLRQICCHPSTFLENYRGDSGKLLYLKETLRDTIKSGHRILLFSQFTGMLSIIKKLLEVEQIDYFYLDGSTKAEVRGQMVQAFNKGERSIFLISLKAGGTGLNLTGADMVIHYDPWWNPAVEEQATDRAYRIGQKNAVQVIKLITRGTIEEKIYQLQQKKKAMIDSVIQPGETMLSKMTEQELLELLGSGLN
ncbi:Superfamily II DNA or RNA helicase, SNF2 family [Desulfotomaculum arcticum]|uniref:Superfamily II DNA or RNA helicase, SNF2 family n=1 Tax=Desulfotruncus arcticus DSM 17038 TaxID=1121424 RepID=A0A1I2Z3D6_9FIRM|nr:DEAD/DEAH box helicase [Desulfotruncus arcticus]SFH32210.1 Superfamily II DNA or RNA helicase, SNF2 family [Desulfotomaculum arcticum] [Desulfotruncus arcticus DSM 17038]